jgi:HAD superfamily hydrolase (TIGR01509 family)/HAD superfamily hydrolase (TIGR01549 family)
MNPLNNTLRYDMVIFDVGGTLIGFWDREPFQQFLAQVGLPATAEHASSFHSRVTSVIRAQRDSVQGLGAEEAALDAWWRIVFREIWPHSPQLAEEMYRWFRDDRFQSVLPDVLPALEALQGQGMPMAVLSNFTSRLEDLLRRLNLRRFFDFVMVSSIVGIAKPDPRIFDLAVAKANRPARGLLYVGDHVGDDIEGAKGAGLDAVLIDRGDRQPDARCSRIQSLVELPDYVRHPTRPAPNIIFDMDGVVLDSMPTHLDTWQRTLRPLGIELTAQDLYPLEGTPTELTAQRLTERFLGKACSDAEAQRLADEKRARFRELFKPSFITGVPSLLYNLHGRGYRLGLVTGSARSVVEESLNPTGITKLFDVTITGDQVGRGKPDPEPYRQAAAGMGVNADQCLVVENAPQGIQSAKAAGMGCVALETTLPRELLSAADRVFPDARSLAAWLLAG